MSLDLSFISQSVTIAIEAVALIEAVKVFLSKKKLNVPAWVYTAVSLLLSFGLSLIQCEAFTWHYIREQLPIGLLAFSVSQLGYDSIWKAVQKKLKAMDGGGDE